MQEMQKLKAKAMKLKKYYEKKQRKDQEDIEERVERLQQKFDRLQNHQSGTAEGWDKVSSIFSNSDLCLETTNIVDEHHKQSPTSTRDEDLLKVTQIHKSPMKPPNHHYEDFLKGSNSI